MDQKQAITELTSKARQIPQLQGLYLVGSFGRGLEDDYSDIDMVAVADSEDHAAVSEAWKGILVSLWPIVFMNTRSFGATLINAITKNWLRCDLIIEPEDHFSQRTKSHTKLQFERTQLYEKLADTLPTKSADTMRMEQIIKEFIRVLGLLVVGDGRGEYFTSVAGTQILRDQFAQLLIETKAIADPGGTLHLSRNLSESDMALLRSLPIPQIDRASIIHANIETAKLFFPVARKIAIEHELNWPDSFEIATQKYLQNALGDEFDVVWMVSQN